MNKSFRVIHLPTTVGGNPQSISRNLCNLDVFSESWALRQNYFGYLADKFICSDTDRPLIVELKRIISLRYIFKCDVAFFNFGTGLFSPFPIFNYQKMSGIKKILAVCYCLYSNVMAKLEIFLIKLLKKRIFIQYQGDDARQGEFCEKNFRISLTDHVEMSYYTKDSDKSKRRSIAFYENTVDKIYALNPDLLHVLPPHAEFLPYSHISLSDWLPIYSQNSEKILRLGHAPSHRKVKGTEFILRAVERLKIAGYKFEFVLIENLSNAEAKEIYKTIDVLVDQLIVGWYGGLAVELMALGKPVIAYIRQEDLDFIPHEMKKDLPIIEAEPDTIYAVLEKVLNMPRTEILNIAHKSRAYVERWHDPLAIARRIRSDMENALEKTS